MILQLILSALAAAISLKAVATLYQRLNSPLRRIRGPRLASLTSGWYAWKIWQGSFQDVNLDLHQRYGKSGLSDE
jgi:hypothetical protein